MVATFDDIRLIGPPAADGEYVALGEHEIVHLHDYPRIYAVPGLYEHIVQERLRCRSPQVAAEGLLRAITRLGLDPGSMSVLDVGSGTGLVGELVRNGGVARVIGVDALTDARTACLRDRPGVYADYLVGDLGSGTLPARLREYAFDGLISAGAFGAAVELLVERGELVLSERERFRHRVTTTGEPIFYELILAAAGG